MNLDEQILIDSVTYQPQENPYDAPVFQYQIHNSCALYKANLLNTRLDGDLTIATGYALSKDGMWRQHSWLVLRKCRSYKIVETTEKREAYFGFAMNAEKCLEFMRDNL